MKSYLIQDTTREEREEIVRQALNACGGSCEGCSGCGKANQCSARNDDTLK